MLKSKAGRCLGLSLAVISCTYLVGCMCNSGYYPESQIQSTAPPNERPAAPTYLTGQAISYHEVILNWLDNAFDETGFTIYRDGSPIGSTEAGATEYRDYDLRYATTYTYTVASHNDFGESELSAPCQVTTLNPPLVVTLDKIGVVNDHDPVDLFQGAGDIYVYVAVSDGIAEPQACRIPDSETIELNDNESEECYRQLFSTDCAGDELRIVAVAFEADPAGVTTALALLTAIMSYVSAPAAIATNMITILLESQPTSDEGMPEGVTAESPQDDFVGAIEITFRSGDDWGIGSHQEIRSGDLRLWFTISIPDDSLQGPGN